MKENALPTQTETPPLAAYGSTVIGIPILLTAVRCTLQYILVPFVLPVLGVSSAFSPLANIAAGLLGVGVILYNLRRLWRTNWRKRYMLLAGVFIPFILVSIYFDYIKYSGM